MTQDASRQQGLVLGVVGHRPDVFVHVNEALMRDQVRTVLLLACRQGEHVSLISPVAEGADRLVAREALALELPLSCLLPFSRDVYVQDFTSQESIDEYWDLLRRAQSVRDLPGVRGTATERDAAYSALSDALIDQIDLLIAIWDGREARGVGGTAHTVNDALRREIPVVWISTAPPHDARLLSLDADGAVRAEPLASLSRWARS